MILCASYKKIHKTSHKTKSYKPHKIRICRTCKNLYKDRKSYLVFIKKSNLQSAKAIYVEPEIVYMRKYIVPDTYEYFLFDIDGCTRLIAGTTLYLCEKDKVIGYKNGHIKEIILGYPLEEENPEKLIFDILKYHPQSERYVLDEFIDVTPSEVAMSYLESCYRNGRINTVVKRYIEGGLI